MLDAFYVFDTTHDRFRAQQIAANAQSVQAVPNNFGAAVVDTSPSPATRRRIDAAITAADCLVVLVGVNTAEAPYVHYAIGRAVHEFGTPVIGVRIDKLADENGDQGTMGDDPFTRSGLSARSLLQIETYDPQFTSSAFTRAHIKFSLRDWMELAIRESVRRNQTRDRRAHASGA